MGLLSCFDYTFLPGTSTSTCCRFAWTSHLLTLVIRQTAFSDVSFVGELQAHGTWHWHLDGCRREKMAGST